MLVVGIVIYYLSSDIIIVIIIIIIVIIIIIMIPTIKQQLQPMSFDGEGTELPSLRLQSGNTYYDEDEDDDDSDGSDDKDRFASKYY